MALSPPNPDELSDADIAQILGLSSNASQQSKLELQAKLAAALRDKNMPKGQMAGGLYIPPNPLDSAMSAFDHMSGIMQGNDLQTQGGQLDSQRQAALERFARLWFKKNQPTADVGSDADSGGGGSAGGGDMFQ